MRAWDGSFFDVDWAYVTDPDATTLPLVHPFGPGRDDPMGHEDLGYVGEVPVLYAPSSKAVVPDRVCGNCFMGDPVWWESGWPSGTPPVLLAPDGWAVGCGGILPMPVQSVGLQMPTEFSVAGSPVTFNGVFLVTKEPQIAHYVWAGPLSGTAPPTFRPLDPSDLPGFTPAPPAFTVGWFIDAAGVLSGLPTIGSYTLQDGEMVLNVDAVHLVESGPWVVHTGAWTRPTWYATGETFTNYVIVNVIAGVNGMVGDYSPCLWQGAPYAIGDVFSPWVVDTALVMWSRVGTGGFHVGGSGNITVTPLVNQPTNLPGSFTVSLVQNPSVNSIQIPTTVNPTTPLTIYVDITTDEPTFNDVGGNPLDILTSGTGLKVGVADIDYTQFIGLPGTSAVVQVGILPKGAILLDMYGYTTQAWTPNVDFSGLDWGFTLNAIPPASVGFGLSLTPSLSAWDSSTGYISDGGNPTFATDQIHIWCQVTVTTALAAILSGHSKIYYYYFQRP